MIKNSRKLGEMNYDGLFAGLTPAAQTGKVTLRALDTAATLARGTLLGVSSEDGKCVVYGTDAFSAGLEVVDTAAKEMCGQVIYPAAVMKNSAHIEAAQAFLDYLTGDEAMKVFEGVGFSKAA